MVGIPQDVVKATMNICFSPEHDLDALVDGLRFMDMQITVAWPVHTFITKMFAESNAGVYDTSIIRTVGSHTVRESR